MRGGFKVFVSGAALVAMTFAVASTASAQEPAAAAPQEKKPPTFPLPASCQDCDVALITVLIRADKTADFEMVLNKVKDALAKSEDAQRKQQAAGWTVFKGPAPVKQNIGGQQVEAVIYLMRIDPIVKGADYDLMRIISDVFPVEAQELFLKYKEAFAGRAVNELKRLMPMQ
jgi:hypothetical protein